VTHQHPSILVHSTHAYLPVKMEQKDCSETLAYKLQTPGNYPKESIQHLEHSESLKSRVYTCWFFVDFEFDSMHTTELCYKMQKKGVSQEMVECIKRMHT
jgi:hypothetical protein